MSAVCVRSIGGYEGSPANHPQRQLDASLRAAIAHRRFRQ